MVATTDETLARIDASQEAGLVSVIVPARNAQATLAEALESVIRQTVSAWEVIVVDDGSDDRTAEIAAAYARRDKRFGVVQGKAKGASAARNTGIAKARGEWLLFLDADDWIEPSHLEKLVAALRAKPEAALAYSAGTKALADGRLTAPEREPRLATDAFEMLARSNHIAIHSVIVSRDLVREIGGFDPSLKTCEDWDLWQRIARLGRPWAFVDEPLSVYRVGAGTLGQNDRVILDAITVIERGFAADPRVPNAAREHSSGAKPTEGRTPDLAIASLSLWYAAIDCARGGTGKASLAGLSRVAPEPGHSKPLMDALAGGLGEGLGVPLNQVADHWQRYAAAIGGLFEEVGRLWDPVAARRLQYGMEQRILWHTELPEPRTLGLTCGLQVDLDHLSDFTPPPGVDRLQVEFLRDGARQRRVELGVLGAVTATDWLRLALDLKIPLRPTAYGTKAMLRSNLAVPFALQTARRLVRHPLAALSGSGRNAALSWALWRVLDGAAGRTDGSHLQILRQLGAEIGAKARRAARAAEPTITKSSPRWSEKKAGLDRKAYWDDVYRDPDPWNYGSPYEQEKYLRQLDILPEGPIQQALELACAEGRFTLQLAPLVERLIATDISQIALDRTKERCADQANVSYAQVDLLADDFPPNQDLIVCSEVLYFLTGDGELEKVVGKMAAALKPGGSLIAAHAFVLNDDSTKTGFDWTSPFGAETICRMICEIPGMSLEKSLQTELYRIDRFVRDAAPADPVIETLPINAPIDPEVARHIVWGGAVARRAAVLQSEQRTRVPVLMYHRIADDGPEALANYRVSPAMFRAQMAWLRRQGFHTINSGQLAWYIRENHPIAGRPVVISFDDAFQDFADEAWPILKAHDFGAEVFVVSDLAGGVSEWDAGVGGAFPLMDGKTITALSREGVVFGSHLATHRPSDGLSTHDLAWELLESRAVLEGWLGAAPSSVAAPFGRADDRFRRLAAECGYAAGFSTEPRVASLEDDPMNIPRIEVEGGWTLDDFIARMEAAL